MNEHRLTDRLTTYWNTVRKEAQMPEFAHFNASVIADIWQQCVLFSILPTVAGKIPSLSCQKVGDALISIYGHDAVGKTFNPVQRHFPGAAVVSKVTSIMENPAPLVDMGQFVGSNSKVVKYRSCLLPFGRQGVVTHVIAGLSWKEF